MRRPVKLFLALLMGVVLCCPALLPAAVDEFAARLRAGIEEAHQGDLSEAMGDLEAAVRLDPTNAEGWYQLGLLRGQLADFRGAEDDLRHAIQLKPDLAPAHYSLGLTLTANPQSKLDWPGAILEFREALKYQPDYPEALNLLGLGLTSSGQSEAAIPELERAIRLKPSFSAAHFNLAIALEKSDRLDEAVKQYQLAVSTKGGYPEATTALGKLLFRLGKADEAQQELNKALRLNPDLNDAHYALARVLQSLHRTGDAKIEFDQAKSLIQRGPDATESSNLSNAALELAAKGDLAGAAASLRKAIALKPDYGIPHYNLGLILADQGDTTGAVQELTKAISLMPGQAKPWFDLGRVLRQQGNHQGALEAVAWSAHLSPSDAVIRAELVSLQSGVTSGAAATQSTAPVHRPSIGVPPDTAEGHIAFAAELGARGDFMGAVGELLRALALQPAANDARRSLASAYLHIGDLDHAILEYYKILRSVPEDAAVHLALGKILLDRGHAQAAADEFRSALMYQPDSAEARAALHEAMRAR
jgi:tetratricopeptide (TPR) repeat protein